jgi:anaerobic magnesium-protoporphyrin IX monomethyl ester cyclase
MNKIALINPPDPEDRTWVREGRCQQIDIWGAPFPPFTLALLSRRLTENNSETIIIDAGPEKKSLSDVLMQCRRFEPSALVLTTSTPTIDADLSWFLTAIKAEFPKIIVVAVGVHVTALPKETLELYPLLDFIILGEPETIAAELFNLDHFSEENLAKTPGIAFRSANGDVKVNPAQDFVDDLDALGLPDWEKINFENYIMPIIGKPFSMIHFARGCPHRCTFCTAHVYNGRGFRKRSIPSLIKEIEFNISLGVNDFLFWTELMTADSKYLNSFLDALIETGLHKKIRWVCNSRTDTVNQEMLHKMKKAGCWQVAFGFDFGSDRMLKQTLKGGRATVEQSRLAAKWAHKAGLVVDGHFMIGYPGETESEILKTIDLALSTPLTFSHFYSVVPYPGTQLYKEWSEKNKILASATNGTPNGSLNGSSWSQFDQQEPLTESVELSKQRLLELKKAAYRRFYFRPVMFHRILRIPSGVQEFMNLFRISWQTAKTLILWN